MKPPSFGAGPGGVKAFRLKLPSAQPRGLKATLKPALKITPAVKGALVLEHGHTGLSQQFQALKNPKTLVFPNTDRLVKHLATTSPFPWEGNKTGTPKPRGAMKAHRLAQVEATGYASAAKAYAPSSLPAA